MHESRPSDESSRAARELSSIAALLHASLMCFGARISLEILGHLSCGPMTVGTLAAALELDTTLTSKYLKMLKIGGLVRMHKSKKLHIFELADSVCVRRLNGTVEFNFVVEGCASAAIRLPQELLSRLRPAAFTSTDPPAPIPFPGPSSRPKGGPQRVESPVIRTTIIPGSSTAATRAPRPGDR